MKITTQRCAPSKIDCVGICMLFTLAVTLLFFSIFPLFGKTIRFPEALLLSDVRHNCFEQSCFTSQVEYPIIEKFSLFDRILNLKIIFQKALYISRKMFLYYLPRLAASLITFFVGICFAYLGLIHLK